MYISSEKMYILTGEMYILTGEMYYSYLAAAGYIWRPPDISGGRQIYLAAAT